mmetsp:Transcript_19525/g.67707  ORF Transcript_19525/g.67707 Transcript_19525/m.67707 type:complete len:242 (-) Transcript_19525:703-1428(-)
MRGSPTLVVRVGRRRHGRARQALPQRIPQDLPGLQHQTLPALLGPAPFQVDPPHVQAPRRQVRARLAPLLQEVPPRRGRGGARPRGPERLRALRAAGVHRLRARGPVGGLPRRGHARGVQRQRRRQRGRGRGRRRDHRVHDVRGQGAAGARPHRVHARLPPLPVRLLQHQAAGVVGLHARVRIQPLFPTALPHVGHRRRRRDARAHGGAAAGSLRGGHRRGARGRLGGGCHRARGAAASKC